MQKIKGLNSITGVLTDARLSPDKTSITLQFGNRFNDGKCYTIEYSWPTGNTETDHFFLVQLQKLVPGVGLTKPSLDYQFIRERLTTWEAADAVPVIWMQETYKFKGCWFIKPLNRYQKHIKLPWQTVKKKFNGNAVSDGLGVLFSHQSKINVSKGLELADILIESYGSKYNCWPALVRQRYELLNEIYEKGGHTLIAPDYKDEFLREMNYDSCRK